MDNIALDTNILIYLYDTSNINKRTTTEGLLVKNPIISSQVVSEYLNVSKRLLKISKQNLLDKCLLVFGYCIITPVIFETLTLARELIIKYDFQMFDSIIIAAALQADCTILYSEDLQSNQLIESRLSIINPFA